MPLLELVRDEIFLMKPSRLVIALGMVSIIRCLVMTENYRDLVNLASKCDQQA